MSQIDLERLVAACEKDATLSDELAGLRDDPAAWRGRAGKLGYDLTPEEASSLLSGTSELTDEELEEVAGGWDDSGDQPPPPPPGGDD